MIPKIIHYCWFGTNPMPPEWGGYIDRWHKVMPDYQIIEWNDSNLNELICNEQDKAIVSWCYEDKKRLGFLSDFLRYSVLYKYGGFYVDTDVEILKRFDIFLEHKNVFGYIFDALVGTAILGAEKGSKIYFDLLHKLYEIFKNEKRLSVSNIYVTQYLLDTVDGFLLNGKNKIYDNLIIFTKDTFEKYSTNKNTGYSWHHCGGSWREKHGSGIKAIVKRLVGKRFYYWLSHKHCMRIATFKDRYEQDKKINNKNDFIIKENHIKNIK